MRRSVARRQSRGAPLSRACSLGHGQGCTDLGTLHEEGAGLDPEKSAGLYRQGCDHGSGEACLYLA
ncbi:MAG: hypothetical protein K6A65_05885 [Succinivibrionaceae bacterium]|nr:hypothetical protein [Succinivibrionaceae bacterium]